MAALTRRTWSDMRTEVLARIGRTTTANTKVEHWIDAVYRELCLTYHHYELDTLAADQAVAADATSLALPADCYAVITALLKTDAGVEIGRLTPKHARFLLGARAATAERPESYSRFGSTIYFAAPTDAAYDVDLYYYKQPAAPDFSTGSPVIDRMWDDFIVQGATNLGLRGYWAVEQAAPHAETLKAFLSRVVNPPLAGGILADSSEQPTIDSSHGGAQG